jgi:hypothetical protein
MSFFVMKGDNERQMWQDISLWLKRQSALKLPAMPVRTPSLSNMPLEAEADYQSLVDTVDASPWPPALKNHLKTPLGSPAGGEKKYTMPWQALLAHLFPSPEYVICAASYIEGGPSRVGADREVGNSAEPVSFVP